MKHRRRCVFDLRLCTATSRIQAAAIMCGRSIDRDISIISRFCCFGILVELVIIKFDFSFGNRDYAIRFDDTKDGERLEKKIRKYVDIIVLKQLYFVYRKYVFRVCFRNKFKKRFKTSFREIRELFLEYLSLELL